MWITFPCHRSSWHQPPTKLWEFPDCDKWDVSSDILIQLWDFWSKPTNLWWRWDLLLAVIYKKLSMAIDIWQGEMCGPTVVLSSPPSKPLVVTLGGGTSVWLLQLPHSPPISHQICPETAELTLLLTPSSHICLALQFVKRRQTIQCIVYVTDKRHMCMSLHNIYLIYMHQNGK